MFEVYDMACPTKIGMWCFATRDEAERKANFENMASDYRTYAVRVV